MLPRIDLHSQLLSNNSPSSNVSGCEGQEEITYVWISFIALCFVLGFPASIAILWEMFKAYRRGRPFTPNDVFVLNLSAMDTIFLVFIPLGILDMIIWKNVPFEAFWKSVYSLNTCGRPLLMACICLDCYLAVVHPITYHKRKSLTPRVVMAGIVWILTVASGIADFLFYKLYYTVFSIVPFIITIVIIGVCDSLILHSLIKSERGKKNIHPQKQRAIQTLINSLVMTVLCYLPPMFLLGIWRLLMSNITSFTCALGISMTVTSSFSSVVMPILHLRNLRKCDCFTLGCCRKS